jgi:flagellar biosynthetic protein FlhB
MTKQEVKDEFKQQEGDPQIKMRLRNIRVEKARKRMMAKVPKADVVVTNPTHYAVALQYDNDEMAAPVVVAKGINLIAERIRKLAEEHKIPLVSNPPLARALYDTVELDQEIPTQHYRAVAQIISYVYKLKKKKMAN